MATAGYYIRANGVRAGDGTLHCGDRWALIRVDSRYQDEVVAQGLSKTDAEALYWQKLEELAAERSASSAAAAELPLGDVAPRRQRTRQLTLKL